MQNLGWKTRKWMTTECTKTVIQIGCQQCGIIKNKVACGIHLGHGCSSFYDSSVDEA
jgi:hypothetical protein